MKSSGILKKVVSFTIIELMITLIISAIVISMGYFSLLFFAHQLINYRKKSSAIQNFEIFKGIMQRDINNAVLITDSVGDIQLFEGFLNSLPVVYHFKNEYAFREANGTADTFNFPISSTELVYISDSMHLVKEITLRTVQSGIVIPAVFTKCYTAKELMIAENDLYEPFH
jgi:prepilin-type N-terminal cleavage/methylation domain-containing protein